MANGIRQESIICTYLFNVYVDELNWILSKFKTRCHLAGEATTNLAHADDLTFLASTGPVINQLLNICETFVTETYIIFNAARSVCMLLTPKNKQKFERSNIYLCGAILEIVENCKDFGHIINTTLNHEYDTQKNEESVLHRQFTVEEILFLF